MDAITNQNKRLAALTNKVDQKYDHKDIHNKIFDKKELMK